MAVKKKTGLKGLTATGVAELWGVTPQAVGLWVKSGCPRKRDGTYDLKSVIRWREQRLSEEGDESSARERKLEAEAQLKELELKKALEQVVPRSEVQAAQVARIQVIKQSFLNLPKHLSPLLVGLEARDIRALLTERIREIISQFAGQANAKS